MLISLPEIYQTLINLRYVLLFPVTIISGPIVTVVAGFLVAQGLMNPYAVYLLVVLGDLTGDLLYYSIGRYGRGGFIDRWGKYVGLSPARLAKLEAHFSEHSGKTLLVGKVAHGLGPVFLTAAGASKMPVRKFMFYNLVGILPKTLILLLVGLYFGQAYRRISQYLDYAALGMVALGAILLTIYLIAVRYGKNVERKLDG